MRATLTWFVMAFVGCGLAQAAGVSPRGLSNDVELFISDVDEAGNYKGRRSLRWKPRPPTGETQRQSTQFASQKSTAAVPASDTTDSAWLPDLSRPWARVLIAMGVLAIVLAFQGWARLYVFHVLIAIGVLAVVRVPAMFVGLWIHRRTRGTDRFRRLPSPVPTVLAASLVQTQLRNIESAETGREEQPKKTRRAA